jgi:phosphatidylglycerophosphatase A
MRKWLVSFGGMGLMPALPGTYASVAAAAVFYLLWLGLGEAARWVVILLTVIVAAVGVSLAHWAAEFFQSPDPRQFVLDEVVGQWVTLLLLPMGAHPLSFTLVGLFLFRAFDVAKPFPVNRAERLPGGWGIMADDVVAALYAVAGAWVMISVLRLALGQWLI